VRRRPPTRVTFGALALAATFVVAAGCSAKAGDACKSGAVCLDGETQLVCDGGTYLASPCRGKAGCRVEGASVLCDTSGNRVGDPCAAADENEGDCTPDGSALMECSKGSFRSVACPGPAGCSAREGKLTCDRSRGSEGDTCTSGGACSLDGDRLLACVGGKLVLKAHCKGPGRCSAQGGGLACDASRGEIGDACATPGGAACGVDGRQMLLCQGDALALHAICRGEGGCRTQDGAVGCVDPTVGQVGDPCPGDVAACSLARDAFLSCKDGKLVEERKCACGPVEGGIGCR
jgi:hypothetical protein